MNNSKKSEGRKKAPTSAPSRAQAGWPADAVCRRRVELLMPYAANSRTHSPEQIAQLAASITEWGFTTPVLIDDAGTIIAGHGRVLAAQKLGLAEVPCMVATGWTDDQKRAYVIADNKLAENAGWDDDILADEMRLLAASDFDMRLVGFSADDERSILAENFVGNVDEDDAPEPPETPVTKHGDVWVLGRHRIICGDSTLPATYASLCGGELVDLVFTDPPYNVAYEGRGKNDLGTIKNDDMSDELFTEFLVDLFDALADAMKPLACIYVCHPDSRSAPKIAFEQAFARYFHKASTLIWLKQSAGMGWQDYRAQHEPILYGWKEGKGKHFYCGDRAKTTVWAIGRDSQAGYVHPTQKPVALPAEAIENSSKHGDVVLDPFLGSGSTLIAAEKIGRTCLGIELDPKYCDVIVRRWETFTGQKALHENGKTFSEISNG